jgi:5-(carboxyamino)imidazole ribonucleotide synthase
MMAQSAIRMGLAVRTLSPSPAGPVASLGEAMVGDWTNPEILRSFADGCAAITVESEWAPADLLAPLLPESIRLYPTPATLEKIRHKGRQKRMLREAGLPVAAFRLCESEDQAMEAANAFGFPVLLKKFEGSYDGYGNRTAHNREDIARAWKSLVAEDGLLVEAFVPFRRELAVLVARGENGNEIAYPVAHTIQRDHRCHSVAVPADVSEKTGQMAREIAMISADVTGMVGMLGVELFELESGDVLINELAPRPHNTGHYSIEGSHTSQFENHVRAVMGWPLGDPGLRSPRAVMVNILGHRAGPVSSNSLSKALAIPEASIHIYGKQETRPRRKMGHVTVTGTDARAVLTLAEKAASLIRL